MDNVWILGGLRSFVGVKDGMYRKISAEILGADVYKRQSQLRAETFCL